MRAMRTLSSHSVQLSVSVGQRTNASMTKNLRAIIVLTCLAACHGERRNPVSATRRWIPGDLVGCFEILDSKRRRADSAWYNAVAFVRLTDRPMRGPDGTVRPLAWHLRPLSKAGIGHWNADPDGELENETMSFVPEWTLSPTGDSAAFHFGDGFSGAAIRFAAADADPDTLRGRVSESWDFGPSSYDRGRAYAVRRTCP